MPGGSSSAAGWSTLLEPAHPREGSPRPGEIRLNEIVEFWQGDAKSVTPGRPVLIGFPQDEGVCRNGGRAGAALAPQEMRQWLYRLAAWDPRADVDLAVLPPLDVGDVREAGMEEMQNALAEVVAEVLERGGIPVVLGGGHEAAYGHYLGYVAARRQTAIINLDAHLDVRPFVDGKGHSGSPFRQALEHPVQPLEGSHYVCLGVQPHATAQEHLLYARQRGCVVRWRDDVSPGLDRHLSRELDRLVKEGCQVYVSLDADIVRAADVPGVSALNPTGIPGGQVVRCARLAGQCPAVSSVDLVEINPLFDRDGQSARWAALALWQFLMGVASRRPTH
jgi:formiminoglutamase